MHQDLLEEQQREAAAKNSCGGWLSCAWHTATHIGSAVGEWVSDIASDIGQWTSDALNTVAYLAPALDVLAIVFPVLAPLAVAADVLSTLSSGASFLGDIAGGASMSKTLMDLGSTVAGTVGLGALAKSASAIKTMSTMSRESRAALRSGNPALRSVSAMVTTGDAYAQVAAKYGAALGLSGQMGTISDAYTMVGDEMSSS